MNFELLTKEDVEGENCLDIFNKISPIASSTYNCNSENCAYWLNSYENIGKHEGIDYYPYVVAANMGEDGNIRLSDLDKMKGVRLKISLSDIKNEILTTDVAGENIFVAGIENGVKVVLALNWFKKVVLEEDKNNLELLNKYSKLIKTGKVVSISKYEGFRSVFYKKKIFVKVYDTWFEVAPIEWYLDEKAKVLVSKSVLFDSKITFMPGAYHSSYSFEQSDIKEFIDKHFAKECFMDEEHKCMMMRDMPFAIRSYEYSDELEELYYWENYRKEIEKRDKLLSDISNMHTMSSEELNQKIAEITEINKIHENIIKKSMPGDVASYF